MVDCTLLQPSKRHAYAQTGDNVFTPKERELVFDIVSSRTIQFCCLIEFISWFVCGLHGFSFYRIWQTMMMWDIAVLELMYAGSVGPWWQLLLKLLTLLLEVYQALYCLTFVVASLCWLWWLQESINKCLMLPSLLATESLEEIVVMFQKICSHIIKVDVHVHSEIWKL